MNVIGEIKDELDRGVQLGHSAGKFIINHAEGVLRLGRRQLRELIERAQHAIDNDAVEDPPESPADETIGGTDAASNDLTGS